LKIISQSQLDLRYFIYLLRRTLEVITISRHDLHQDWNLRLTEPRLKDLGAVFYELEKPADQVREAGASQDTHGTDVYMLRKAFLVLVKFLKK
jgi:hypothetical protein